MCQTIRSQDGNVSCRIRISDTILVEDLEYNLPVKFRWVSLNSMQRLQRRSRIYEKLTTDDGRWAMTIAHLSLWLRWANKKHQVHSLNPSCYNAEMSDEVESITDIGTLCIKKTHSDTENWVVAFRVIHSHHVMKPIDMLTEDTQDKSVMTEAKPNPTRKQLERKVYKINIQKLLRTKA